jgi:hypothetical protein
MTRGKACLASWVSIHNGGGEEPIIQISRGCMLVSTTLFSLAVDDPWPTLCVGFFFV